MLTIVRGLPGSGKSTLANQLATARMDAGEYIEVFEADQYFETAEGYKFDPSKLKDAHADCQRRVRDWLEDGSAIVANTFTQRWEYQPYLDMAKELGVPVQVIEVYADFGSVHNVPDETLARMKARWEPHNG